MAGDLKQTALAMTSDARLHRQGITPCQRLGAATGSLFRPEAGQASSRGAQLFGAARTLERDDPEAVQYWEAFRCQSDHAERGLSLSEPPTDPLTVITPARILYTEHWLRRDGYRPRQTWQRS